MTTRLVPLFLVALLIGGCSDPVPTGKRHYVGTWEAENMVLVIRPNGTLAYARQEDDKRTRVNGPIKTYDGNDLVVGFGWFTTTFEVQTPPRIENGQWIMKVDGVRLERTGTFDMPAPDGPASDAPKI